MLLNLIPPQYQIAAKLVALLIFVSSLLASGYHWGHRVASSKYKLEISAINEAHTTASAKALEDTLRIQETNRLETQNAEVKYRTELEALRATKPTIVVKRLYDPGSRKVCPSPLPKTGDPGILADTTDDGGTELSAEAGRFLQEEALRANIIVKECNLYRKSAHEWAKSLL